MNTELRLDHIITGSNKHGKSAKDIRFTDSEITGHGRNSIRQQCSEQETHMARLQIITVSDFAEITSGCNVQSYQTTCYRNLSWQTKAWHESTNYIELQSLTDYEPKRIRKYDGTHVNMASYITDSYMAGTTISRHVGELEPLTTEQ